MARLPGGVAATGHRLSPPGCQRRPLRRAGGGKQARPSAGLDLEVPKDFSDKVLSQFKVETTCTGERILTRLCSRDDLRGDRHVRVVAIEDLPALLQQQMESLGVTGVQPLFKHLYHNLPTHMASKDDTPCTIFGLTGFTKKTIAVYLQEDPLYADSRPLTAAEKAPPEPIIINFVFQQCQVDLLDLGAGRDPRFRYVLVYIELFSRRLWLRVLSTKEARLVATEDTVLPGVLQSDNGTEFCATIMKNLCALYGVRHVQGSVGHPQSQGAVERANKIVKDKIRAELMRAPTTSWPQQILRVESMINNQPCTMFNQGKTRNQMLFGALSQHTQRPSAEALADLLGFSSSEDAVNNHAAARVCVPPATAGQVERSRAAATGTKRKAAAAGLVEAAELEAGLAKEASLEAEMAEEVGQAAGEDSTGLRRTSRRAGGALFEALLAAEAAGEEESVPTRLLPQRASAALSPAGQCRQRQAPMLEQLAAAAQEAAAKAAQEDAAAEVAAQGEGDEVGAGGDAPCAAAATQELPEHLVALRSAGDQDHAKNRKRIAAQGRNGKRAKTFSVGDTVLMVPQKCGHAGGATIDLQSIVCRVVGVQRPGGHTKYKLRCNSGVLEGLFFSSQMRVAPQRSAATLTFKGVETQGVPVVSLAGAKAAQRVGGVAADPCRCRGKCSQRCKCKGSCSRACGCKGFCTGCK